MTPREVATVGVVGAVAAGLVAAAFVGRREPPTDQPPERRPPSGGGGGGGSDRGVYRTPLADVRMHESGWAAIGPGIEVTAVPLVQSHPPPGILFARITWAEAKALADAWGVDMITAEIGALVYQRGLRLAPCTLWEPGADAHMQSEAWCARHDRCVVGQLDRLWDGRQAVADCGKDWIWEPGAGAKAVNWGWHDPSGRVIQSPGHRHELSYTDYSQLTRFFRRV